MSSHADCVTWNEDPAHFAKPGRREFLRVGVVGALGLTLGDFLKMQARGESKDSTNSLNFGTASVTVARLARLHGRRAKPRFYGSIEYSIGNAVQPRLLQRRPGPNAWRSPLGCVTV